MESQPQNPEIRINPENFHPCRMVNSVATLQLLFQKPADLNLLSFQRGHVLFIILCRPQKRHPKFSTMHS